MAKAINTDPQPGSNAANDLINEANSKLNPAGAATNSLGPATERNLDGPVEKSPEQIQQDIDGTIPAEELKAETQPNIPLEQTKVETKIEPQEPKVDPANPQNSAVKQFIPTGFKQVIVSDTEWEDYLKYKDQKEVGAIKAAAPTPQSTTDTTTKSSPNAAAVAESVHNNRVTRYGADYITASRGSQEKVFTRQSWDLLGGNNNTDGWKQQVKTPPEVQNLSSKLKDKI